MEEGVKKKRWKERNRGRKYRLENCKVAKSG